MGFLAEHSIGKVLQDDALRISKEAGEMSKIYPDVVNGILGTYHADDGSFKVYDFVKRDLNDLRNDWIYSYSTSDGGHHFENACINHLFKNYVNFIKSEMEVKVIATPGGTGALVSAVYSTLDKGQTLLIPDPCWGPYKGICKHRDINFKSYKMFKNDRFNLDGLMEIGNKVIEEQKKLVVMVNDPCHNPTGYSMTNDELRSLIGYMNDSGVPCILIYDCAYLDMSSDNEHKSREKFKIFRSAKENVCIIAGVSFSKTYAMYGLRLGAEVIISKNREEAIDLYNCGCYLARNTWSSCNHGAISVVVDIDIDKSMSEKLEKELNTVQASLKRRSEIFLNEARACGLKTDPYRGGFFISIPCEDNKKLFEALKREEHLFLLPVSSIIRVAICGITEEKIKGMASKIKKQLDLLGQKQ